MDNKDKVKNARVVVSDLYNRSQISDEVYESLKWCIEVAERTLYPINVQREERRKQ